METMSISTAILLLVCGAFGALVKDIIQDNKLKLPKIVEGELVLGFLGAITIGAFVGYFVDHSPLMAFFAGYTGFSALESLLPKTIPAPKKNDSSTTDESEKKNGAKIFSIRKPFAGDYKITQKFGENPDWYKSNGFAGHFGIDFATPWGTPILSCDLGEIVKAGKTSGNGNYCVIQHEWGTSLYCHFKSQCTLPVGSAVARGEKIGEAGNTGAVRPAPTAQNPKAGTHCHFSITVAGLENLPYKNYIDPMPYFEKGSFNS